jgi:hypothetical protein
VAGNQLEGFLKEIFSCSFVAARRYPDGHPLQVAVPCGKKVEDFSNLLQPAAPFRIGSLPQEHYEKTVILTEPKNH